MVLQGSFFLQRCSGMTTRGLMSEDIKWSSQKREFVVESLWWKTCFYFSCRAVRANVAPVDRYTDSCCTHRLFPEQVISIVPKMDGHSLLGSLVLEQGGLSSPPLACLLTCSWVLVNIQGLGSRTQVPSSPKKLEVVIFQEQLANLPRPCKCKRHSRLAQFLL